MTSQATEAGNLHHWRFREHEYELGTFPLIMGILNVTPDSFSDGQRFLEPQAAVAHGLELIDEGADVLDVGGESTRPGAAPVSVDEELRRVLPVIESLAQQVTVPISIDTTKAEVARQALLAGAQIVNDISGLTFDIDMPKVCAAANAGVICMHIQGTPQTMQLAPNYNNVVQEVRDWLANRLNELCRQGIPREAVMLDPGIGFGKTAQHNLQLLAHIQTLRSLDRPVLVGHSRKRFLSKILGRPVEERTSGTIGVSVALAMQSTDMLRVHEVRATRDALTAWQTIAQHINKPV